MIQATVENKVCYSIVKYREFITLYDLVFRIVKHIKQYIVACNHDLIKCNIEIIFEVYFMKYHKHYIIYIIYKKNSETYF